MVFGISKDPSRLISGALLILVGVSQVMHIYSIDTNMTLVVAGAFFIMEALNW